MTFVTGVWPRELEMWLLWSISLCQVSIKQPLSILTCKEALNRSIVRFYLSKKKKALPRLKISVWQATGTRGDLMNMHDIQIQLLHTEQVKDKSSRISKQISEQSHWPRMSFSQSIKIVLNTLKLLQNMGKDNCEKHWCKTCVISHFQNRISHHTSCCARTTPEHLLTTMKPAP